MNPHQARTLQHTARDVNEAAQHLHHATGEEATMRAAWRYVLARRAHNAAVADAEDPEGEAPTSRDDG